MHHIALNIAGIIVLYIFRGLLAQICLPVIRFFGGGKASQYKHKRQH